ncbi:peroxiredoxin [Thiotrichales bacterium 19S3-7]|nr:peroxiredoxin [Thiotrichales bacterium 19S3-7]MCF6801685.1 peroxiredoxin [Thiotrichales bacterium 19S3-11]
MASTFFDQTIPPFSLPMTSEKTFSLDNYHGKHLVIYFYPKDSTPGCTSESKDFRDLYSSFQAQDTEIIGISRDSLKSHEKFKENLALPFELASDTEEVACKLFDVMKEKSMFGKKYMGIERSTFLINPKGQVIKEWRKVKVTGHAKAVLKEISQG